MRELDGQELPDWLTKELYDEIKEVGKVYFGRFIATEALRMINAGAFLGDLKSKIERLIANDSGRTAAETANGYEPQTKKLNMYPAVSSVSKRVI